MIHFIKPDLAWRRHDRLNITYYIIICLFRSSVELKWSLLNWKKMSLLHILHLVFGVLFIVIKFYEIPVNRDKSVTLAKHLA